MTEPNELERDPVRPEPMPWERSFNEVIQWAIERIPEPERVIDPYKRPSPLRISYPSRSGYTHHKNGYVEFGNEFEVRRLRLGLAFDLMFAFDTGRREADFVVNEFAAGGGVESQTWFRQLSDGTINKSWNADEFGGLIGDEGKHFSRHLDDSEIDALKRLVVAAVHRSPQVQNILHELVSVKPFEQEMIDHNEQVRANHDAELQRDLDDIRAAERAAWEDADKIILD